MKKIVEAMAYLDDEYIKEADPDKAVPSKRIRAGLASIWTASVACVAAIALMIVFVLTPHVYTAEEIGRCFGATNGIATNAYEKIYVPSSEYLNIGEVEYSEYIPIYIREIQKNVKHNDEEIISFTSGILSRFLKEAENLSDEEIGAVTDKVLYDYFKEKGIEYEGASKATPSTEDYAETILPVPTDEKTEEDNEDEKTPRYEDYDFYISQGVSNSIYITRTSNADVSEPIILGDVRIEVDQMKSNKELVEDLAKIKEKLFEIFGESFSDIYIDRYYDGGSKCGVGNLRITFYNTHPLDRYVNQDGMIKPLSSYVEINFDEPYGKDLSEKTEDFLTDATIRYVERRVDAEDLVKEVTKAKMITLAEAEEYLKKGYVFGGHSCPICMSMQDAVDFEDYDYVQIVNFNFRDSKEGIAKEYLPFYAFYKHIDTYESGKLVYGVTYVPAIEVKGYEEYFENQKERHPST